jgi:hypothetical protein
MSRLLDDLGWLLIIAVCLVLLVVIGIPLTLARAMGRLHGWAVSARRDGGLQR